MPAEVHLRILLKGRRLKKGGESFLKKEVEAGTLYPRLGCCEDIHQSYALYLPKSYDPAEEWPVVFIFDPQGIGIRPVELYKELADEFGWILIGSNFSKNGLSLDLLNIHIDGLMAGVKFRFAVNPEQIYAMGFSGGARVAVARAMEDSSIKGVIGCGAGFPAVDFNQFKPRFEYFGLAGIQDFNFTELYQLDLFLEKIGARHFLSTFEGKHSWPEKQEIEKAFRWLTLNSMRTGSLETDQEKIQGWLQDDLENSPGADAGQNEIYNYNRQLISFYQGFSDISLWEKTVYDLEHDFDFQEYKKNFVYLLGDEAAEKSELSQAFSREPENWWQTKVGQIEEQIAKEKNSDLRNSKIRVLSYLSLLAYMHANNALKREDLSSLKKFLSIYKRVDPQNSEHAYLKAILEARKGNTLGQIEALQEAVSLGFEDWTRLGEEPDFKEIRQSPEFTALFPEAK